MGGTEKLRKLVGGPGVKADAKGIPSQQRHDRLDQFIAVAWQRHFRGKPGRGPWRAGTILESTAARRARQCGRGAPTVRRAWYWHPVNRAPAPLLSSVAVRT